jgi:Rnl2 family RNA ligase
MEEHLRFDKYTSIENTYQAPYLEKVMRYVPEDLLWDVTEKVHGANCCLITDGNKVEFAKRTSIVEAEEGFFCYKIVLEEHKERILKAFNYIKERYTDKPIESVQFYGELFGGSYPHGNVPRDSRFTAIQKGLYYAPYQSFYGFDIALCHSDGKRTWLNPDQEVDVYEKNGIFYAKSLFRGTLQECLQFSNAFQTHIPEWLGLPPIEDNICEGVVFKPMIPQFFNDGSRIVLKNKNERFAEKKGEHKHKEVKDVPEDVQNMNVVITEYVTDNRLCNVISHEGEFDMPKEFGRLIKLFTEDILNDFYKEHLAEWNALEKASQKAVTKFMTSLASKTIKLHYGVR